MALPPYMLGPNPWAQQLMAQQQLAAAHHAQAMAHHHAHLQQVHQQQMQIPPPISKPDHISEEKLQEKGLFK